MEKETFAHFGRMENPYAPGNLTGEISERTGEIGKMIENLETLSVDSEWTFTVGEVIEEAMKRGKAEGWPAEEVAALARAVRDYQARLDELGRATDEQSNEIKTASQEVRALLDVIDKISAPGGKA